jgi:hypothetical protein
LHVDCPWRLERENAILVGSDDWFETESRTTPPEDWDPESGGSFQEATLRSLLHDEDTSKRIIRNMTKAYWVEQMTADDMGGCEILMSGRITLRIFPDSIARECWRLLKPGDISSHFIIPPEEKSTQVPLSNSSSHL